MSSLKKMFALFREFWALIIGAGFIGAGTVLGNVGLLGVSAVLISQAALLPPILDLMVLIVAVRFFGIARALLRYLERYITHDITLKILSKLRIALYQGIEPLAPKGLANLADGALYSRLINDLEILKYFYLKAIAAPLAAVIVLLVNTILLFFFSPPAAVVFVVFMIVGGVLIPTAIDKRISLWAEEQAKINEAYHIGLVDYIKGIGPLLMTGAAEQQRENLKMRKNVVDGFGHRLRLGERVSNVLLTFFSYLALWSALAVTIPLVKTQQLAGVYLAMVVLVVWAGFEAVITLPQALIEIRRSQKAADHIFDIIDAGKSCRNPLTETKMPKDNSLIFKNVSFAYQMERVVLSDINLVIPYGHKIALVGSSGSGKSTLVNLLVKFYSPQKGEILLGGVDLANLSDEEVRRRVGFLEQDSYLFFGTIRENLLLANDTADEEQLWQALAASELADFVKTLPEGLETVIGENGFKLSGGQRQRLALARLYLKDSPIIILDEATQGLDTLTADKIMAIASQWWQAKTVIVITHRLHNMAVFDEIVVLQNGRIAERGSEEELLSQKQGVYQKMWNIENTQIF